MSRRVIPFPWPSHIGTDICHAKRIYSLLSMGKGQRFVKRILTQEEIASSLHRVAPILNHGAPIKVVKSEETKGAVAGAVWRIAQFLAGRMAAKEAIIKAHPHRRLTFHDIVIRNQGSEEPAKQATHDDDAAETDELASTDRDNGSEEATGEAPLNNKDILGELVRINVKDWINVKKDSCVPGRGGSGAPIALIKGDQDAGQADQEAMISISHDGEYATAVCIGFDPDSLAGHSTK